jgi:drug/metabolite transporter (DMT)-like permease
MHARTVLALCLELVSTTLISLSYVGQHGAAARLPALSLGRPWRAARLLLTSRAWLRAFAMETCGFGLYVAALALAELALVQTVAAGGVGILAVASARVDHRRLTRRETIGSTLAVGGLVLLAISLSGGGGESSAPAALGDVALWLGATVAAAVLALASRRAVLTGGVAYGIAGGLLFAAGDISAKLATAGGGRFLFVLPLIAGYLLGTALLQIGYQRGGALTVAGIATLLANAVPIAAGTVLLNEPVPTGPLGVIRILAFATVTAGAILLAQLGVTSPGSSRRR